MAVIDNFPDEVPVTAAELDVVEAYLMSAIVEILSAARPKADALDSKESQYSARWEASP
ncbi:hypothetical protein [Methylocella silvestris]|uniref:hypothetical protein n=1 Tax=Methylocella silvestris TaxID=199596 RepID=UPI00164FBE3E|nr:hypothetical protein [Methylocella silvestris]